MFLLSWDNSKGEIYLLGHADIDHNVNEHAGVDEQENKDWKVEPDELVHTTVKVTASETNRVISGHHFIKRIKSFLDFSLSYLRYGDGPT